mgnify:CR=1 FL=1
MKVILKNLLMILLVILLVSWIFPNEAFAAASASISTSSTSIYVGETATISINVSNTETWEVTLTSSGGTLSNTKNGDAYGMEKTTTAMTSNFSANEPGTYTVSFSGTVAGSDLTTVIPVSGSVSINVKEKTTDTQIPNENKENTSNENKPNKNNVPTETKKPETSQVTKSSNNYLSSITVGTGTLSPEFYRETFDYTVEFDDTVNLYDLKEIEISATTEDDRATVEGAGTIQLQEGENNITLTVKAENGSARTYNIKVVKPMAVDQSSLRLKTLVLNGINTNGEYQTINLEFNPDTFEYNITVPNNITSISVNPTTENEDIIIESNGGENLNEGENKIIIILTSPSDDTIKTTYTINIERQVALTTAEEQGLNNKQLGIVIIAGVVGLILLIVIIIAIVKHRKKKKGFGFDDDEEDNEIHFINNEEGEDVKDYDEIESPYPDKIVTSEMPNEEKSKESSEDYKKVDEENLNNIDKKENNDDLKFKTTYDEENIESENHTKSKWDDFVDGYQDEEENKKSKNKKHGRRFL